MLFPLLRFHNFENYLFNLHLTSNNSYSNQSNPNSISYHNWKGMSIERSYRRYVTQSQSKFLKHTRQSHQAYKLKTQTTETQKTHKINLISRSTHTESKNHPRSILPCFVADRALCTRDTRSERILATSPNILNRVIHARLTLFFRQLLRASAFA